MLMNKETKNISTKTIAEKNDSLRKYLPGPLPSPHQVMMTDEISALSEDKIQKVLMLVREFDDFTEANDPHSERDFGAFEFEGQTIFWKFDYTSADMKHFEENGRRVLLIMSASEY